HVYANHEVTAVHPDKKTVTVKDLTNDSEEEVSYDKLILSSGVTPKVLPVPGSDLKNIYLMRGRDWASKLKAATTDPAIKNVAIIGAGYIGTEASEVFAKAGKHVTLMDMIDRPLGTYLNPELLDILEPTFKDH
ncbi:NAD(P)/FAD-dependent oxidoreductase, partial [Lactobacillus acidophilus]